MGDDQRQALARDIARRLQLASLDELRVIDRVLGRLEVGRDRYGLLDLGKPRDWRRERFEERLDALVYDVAEELVLEDAARAEIREAARIEMLGEFAPEQHATRIGGPDPYLSIEVALDDIEGG